MSGGGEPKLLNAQSLSAIYEKIEDDIAETAKPDEPATVFRRSFGEKDDLYYVILFEKIPIIDEIDKGKFKTDARLTFQIGSYNESPKFTEILTATDEQLTEIATIYTMMRYNITIDLNYFEPGNVWSVSKTSTYASTLASFKPEDIPAQLSQLKANLAKIKQDYPKTQFVTLRVGVAQTDLLGEVKDPELIEREANLGYYRPNREFTHMNPRSRISAYDISVERLKHFFKSE